MTILRRVTDLMYRHATEHRGEFPTHVLMTFNDYAQSMQEIRAAKIPMIQMTYLEKAAHPRPEINGLPIIFLEAGEPLAVANLTGEK